MRCGEELRRRPWSLRPLFGYGCGLRRARSRAFRTLTETLLCKLNVFDCIFRISNYGDEWFLLYYEVMSSLDNTTLKFIP